MDSVGTYAISLSLTHKKSQFRSHTSSQEFWKTLIIVHSSSYTHTLFLCVSFHTLPVGHILSFILYLRQKETQSYSTVSIHALEREGWKERSSYLITQKCDINFIVVVFVKWNMNKMKWFLLFLVFLLLRSMKQIEVGWLGKLAKGSSHAWPYVYFHRQSIQFTAGAMIT